MRYLKKYQRYRLVLIIRHMYNIIYQSELSRNEKAYCKLLKNEAYDYLHD